MHPGTADGKEDKRWISWFLDSANLTDRAIIAQHIREIVSKMDPELYSKMNSMIQDAGKQEEPWNIWGDYKNAP